MISYSANESDLRQRSIQLAQLALRAESDSIRSSSLGSSEAEDDNEPYDEHRGPERSDVPDGISDEFDEEAPLEEEEAGYLVRDRAAGVQEDPPDDGHLHATEAPSSIDRRPSMLTPQEADPSSPLQGFLSTLRSSSPAPPLPRPTGAPDERTPLYFGHRYYQTPVAPSSDPTNYDGSLPTSTAELGLKQTQRRWADSTQNILGSLPAVVLGLMMNILDGVSYGMIMFPTGAGMTTFDGFSGIGISMFFMTCIVSQLVYSLGGSGFKGGNGSMMIESVPFMHVIAKKIILNIGSDHPESIIATTMVSFAMSSVLTGLAFFALGALRLGNLMGFFPRHILVGCIGSVGAFLLITGVSVTGRLQDGFSFSPYVFHHLLQINILPLWVVPLGLAIVLRVLTSFFSQPFVVPTYFLVIPLLFYTITTLAGLSLETLRSAGWVFDIELSDNKNPFAFYALFKFSHVDWNALKATITAQLAMVIFGLLHVPLNVPALALSMGKDDVDINKELIAHGISNTLAGLAGTVSNYLCYINSLLFARVGGDSRSAGVLLAVVTMGVFGIGPGVIAYLPVCVVGALIFLLGIDLLKEAVWDTWGKVSWVEYGTIWSIIIAATWHDFVVGLVVGIVLACMSFVATSAQHKPIRSVMDGCTARSTVRRHPTQHAFLKKVGKQTRVLKLQGHLFFGTISACEQLIKSILETSVSPRIHFLIVDFSSAVSIDFSAVEAFLRIHRLLLSKSIVFVICGTEDSVTKALKSVGLWSGQSIEVFEHLNEALEHCENTYLKDLYFPGELDSRVALQRSLPFSTSLPTSGHEISQINPNRRRSFKTTSFNRPKLPFTNEATLLTTPGEVDFPPLGAYQVLFQPFTLLLQTFRPFLPNQNENFWLKLAPYFTRREFKQEMCLWKIGAPADCFYLIQSGILKASYGWPSLISMADCTPMLIPSPPRRKIEESMLPGTVAGDHTFLAQLCRNTTVIAETDTVLWEMSMASWKKIDVNLREIVAIGLLKMAAVEEEVLIGHLFTRF